MRVIVVVFSFIALAQCYLNKTTIENYLILLTPLVSRTEIWISNAERGCPEPLKNSTNTVYLELEACLESSNANLETFCTEFQQNVERCFQPSIDLYTNCLPEKSKDLPQMLINAIVSANKYLCELGGDHSHITEDCIDGDKTQCYYDLEDNADKYFSPTKSDVCKFGTEVKSCTQELLKESCQDNIINLYNAIFSEC